VQPIAIENMGEKIQF